MIAIVNSSSKTIIAKNAHMAESFMARLFGLMFKDDFTSYDCLILSPCRMIHTFGMKFNIDVIFISKSNIIVHTIENLKPNRISPYVKEAHMTIELPLNTIKNTNTKPGNSLFVIL